MFGVDTNVLVRFLVRDVEPQFVRADRWLRDRAASNDPVFVSLLVLLETEWVLRSRYALTKGEIAAAFSALLDSVVFTVEHQSTVDNALFVWNDSNVEFADCLIGAHNRSVGCRSTMTFNATAAGLATFKSL